MSLSITDFDTDAFAKQCYIWAPPFIIVTIAFILVMQYCFDWRPFTYRKYVIANFLHKTPNDIYVTIVEVLFWIFCSLPIIFGILWGVMTAINVKPTALGVDLAVTICAITAFVVGYMNFNKNGFRITKSVIILLGTSALLLVALTVIDVIMMEETSWMSGAYLIIFPGILANGFIACLNRAKIPLERTMMIMESEEKGQQFVEDVSGDKKSDWIVGGAYASSFMKLLEGIVPMAVSAISSGLFIHYFTDYGDTDIATFATALGSLLVDVALMISLKASLTKVNSIILLFVVLIMKDIAVSFSSRFWLAGHAFIILIFGTYLFRKVAFWFFVTFFEKKSDFPGKEALDENVRDAIDEMKTDRNNITFPEFISSLVLYIVFFAAGVTEIATANGLNLEEALNDGTYILDQRDAMVMSLTLTIAIAFILAICDINKDVSLNIPYTIISFACIALVWIISFVGCDLRAYDVNIYVAASYTIFASLLLCGTKKIVIGMPYTIYYILTISSVLIIYIVLPFGESGFTGPIILSLFLAALLFYINVMRTDIEQHKLYYRIGGFVSALLLMIFSIVGFSSLMAGIAFFIFVYWAFLLLWRTSLIMKNSFNATLKDLAYILIPTGVITAAGLIVVFLPKMDEGAPTGSTLLGCIVLFLAFGVIFITLAFYFKHVGKWLVTAILVTGTILEIGDFLLFVYIAKSFYMGLTILCVLAFIFGLGYLLASVSKVKKGNAIIYSDIFFPVRRLKDGQLSSMSVFGLALSLAFFAPWVWGVFSTVFFVYPWFGILGQASAFGIVFLLIFGLLDDFDNTAIQALDIIPKESLTYTVTQAMKSVNTTAIESNTVEEFKLDTYEEYLHYIETKTNEASARSLFASSIRGQLKITGDAEFSNVIKCIEKYMNNKSAKWDYLKDEGSYSYNQRSELINVYIEIEKTQKDQKDTVVKYDNYVQSQEDIRIQKQQEIINSTQDTKSKKYQAICKKLATTNGKYVDQEFYPTKKSSADNELLENGKWMRGEEFLTGPFIGPTSPNDLMQGSLGDCYLVSTLAAISESPERIQNIFDVPILTEKGIYCVNFKVFDQNIPVIVDSNLFTKYSKCRFIEPRDKATSPWWFTIVEKAYAKLNGSFAAIEGGQCHKSLDLFVDGIPQSIVFDSPKGKDLISSGELFNKMVALHKSESYMCAGSASGSDTDQNENGIVLGHAYSIHNAVRIKGFELIQMRNPWGGTEWEGDWSDNSPLWEAHKDIKKALAVDSKDDGMFWISFKDFINNYRVLYFMEVNKNSRHLIIDGKLMPGENDGANGCKKTAPDLTNVTNYLLRFKRPTTLRMKLEKQGAKTNVRVYMIYNKGEPLDRMWCGYKTFQDYCPDFAPFDTFNADISECNDPWTIAISRDKNSEQTSFKLHLFCEDSFEIEELPIPDRNYPPHKIIDKNADKVVFDSSNANSEYVF